LLEIMVRDAKYPEHFRFAAHFAHMLALMNRLTEDSVASYNVLINEHLKNIALIPASDSINQMIPYYVQLMIGSDQMCLTYALIICGLQDSDDSRIKRISTYT